MTFLLFLLVCSFPEFIVNRVRGSFVNGFKEPLILTNYIESGDILKGQKAAYVDPDIWPNKINSYSGFFTVNKTYNSNIFIWYFPSETDPQNAPVAVWLQGGPGSSSLFGLFEENGPFYIDLQGKLHSRLHRWTKSLHMIYIDNPVGAGFSFTESEEGYAKDQERIGTELFSAIAQFYELFPYLKDNELYLTGESYAGKYIPAMAYSIHTNNRKNISSINLKGIALGNALIDPETMLNYADHYYQIGIIDEKEALKFQAFQEDITKHIQQKEFKEASEGFRKLILGSSAKTLFYNFTGFTNFYNFLFDKSESIFGNSTLFLQKDQIRNALHVGNLTFNEYSTKVEDILLEDICKSVKTWFQVILEEYRVLVYSGQLDLIVPYSSTLAFLKSLEWSGAALYESADRKKWHVKGELAGYSKTAKLLTEVLVRNAGHMVPKDQPLRAFDLITRFIFNKPF